MVRNYTNKYPDISETAYCRKNVIICTVYLSYYPCALYSDLLELLVRDWFLIRTLTVCIHALVMQEINLCSYATQVLFRFSFPLFLFENTWKVIRWTKVKQNATEMIVGVKLLPTDMSANLLIRKWHSMAKNKHFNCVCFGNGWNFGVSFWSDTRLLILHPFWKVLTENTRWFSWPMKIPGDLSLWLDQKWTVLTTEPEWLDHKTHFTPFRHVFNAAHLRSGHPRQILLSSLNGAQVSALTLNWALQQRKREVKRKRGVDREKR